MDERLFVATSLARALDGRNALRGYDISTELLGHGYWSTVCVALGGRPLSDTEDGAVAALGVLAAIGDPRIWPMKLARLVASYGRPSTAAGAAHLVLDRAVIGPQAAADAAAFIAGHYDEHAQNAATLLRAADEHLSNGRRVPGFGVPMRSADERSVAFDAWMADHPRAVTPLWEAYQQLCRHMAETHQLMANFAGPIASIGLAVGLPPAAILPFCSHLTNWGVLANAFEGTRESPEILRRLPGEYVRYKGPAPRRSPRAEGRDG